MARRRTAAQRAARELQALDREERRLDKIAERIAAQKKRALEKLKRSEAAEHAKLDKIFAVIDVATHRARSSSKKKRSSKKSNGGKKKRSSKKSSKKSQAAKNAQKAFSAVFGAPGASLRDVVAAEKKLRKTGWRVAGTRTVNGRRVPLFEPVG